MIAALLAGLQPALADEGMWLPEQVPALAERLRGMGLGVDPAQLADPMGQPLGSLASLGNCTASFISADGLMVTAAHCVTDYLEYASDDQHDHTLDGFTATDRRRELPAGPAAHIWITERIDDVTAEMQAKLGAKVADRDRTDAIERAASGIVATCERKRERRCSVVPLYEGRQWRLVVRKELHDVRVVYAPPQSVSMFGGDADNWAWPRHCGDFALIRAWAAPDGSSAPYSEANIPYTPEHFLRVEPGGARPGEFVMMAGYPANTFRWRTAVETRHAEEVRYPSGVDLLQDLLQTATDSSRASRESALKLESTLFRYRNTLKSFEGMIDNFSRSHITSRKEAFDAGLDAWVAADQRRAGYAGAVAELRGLLREELATWRRDRLVSGLTNTPRLLGVALTGYHLAFERQFPDVDRDPGFQSRDVSDIRDRFKALARSLDLPSDRALFRTLLVATQDLPANQRIPPIDAWIAAAGGIDAGLDAIYASRALVDLERRERLLTTDQVEFERSGDPWVRLAVALETWHRSIRSEKRARDGALARLRPIYMDALIQFRPGTIYPEANGTLRLSFGKVEGYTPEDGAVYLPHTTLGGMAAKVRGAPFHAPARVLEEVPNAPRSRWSDPTLGDVPVDFLTTLDNTGGSSGSPAMNAHGALVGITFDRNWEAVAADWMYDPALTRSIHVDVRYLLWSLDQVDHAAVLLAEMGVDRGR
ncbi:MAG: S46 family peptidase [Myxococcales bacterium]|nr:S46 family peptidase [Myxococcales bacterium]